MSVSCFLIFILLLLSSFYKSDDQLTHEKPLSPSNKLISKSRNFSPGYFCTTCSNKSLYHGIWYNNIPSCIVV